MLWYYELQKCYVAQRGIQRYIKKSYVDQHLAGDVLFGSTPWALKIVKQSSELQ